MQKGIIIVDQELPLGLKANISAILGMSLGRKFPETVGTDVVTHDGMTLAGITQIPVPILQSSSSKLCEIFIGNQGSDVFLVSFDESALTTKTYSDYQEKISTTTLASIKIHGLLAYGPKKSINKIGANLALLR